jgi:hypothetical protein
MKKLLIGLALIGAFILTPAVFIFAKNAAMEVLGAVFVVFVLSPIYLVPKSMFDGVVKVVQKGPTQE